MISTKLHGLLDYLVSIILILSPWIFGFAGEGYATNVPVVSGLVTIFYSMWTNYEYSMAPAIPMRVHLMLDLVSAIVLVSSPWLFRFSNTIWWPHVTVGVLELIVVSLSRRTRGHRA